MAATAPKTADNYRKQIDYWKKQAWKARQDATFSRSERDDAREKYLLAEALVKKQDADIAAQKAQIQRLVDKNRDNRSDRERMYKESYEEVMDQLHDMFRKRNELRTKCEAYEADVSRWDTLMKDMNETMGNLQSLLKRTFGYWVFTVVVAAVSISVNAIQWFTR